MKGSWFALLAVLLFVMAADARALTGGQFAGICDSAGDKCREHPLLQAYVGGALDLLAVLDDAGLLQRALYCRPAGELFDVESIIDFMQLHADRAAERNAMWLVLDYLKQEGGCKP